MSGINEKPTSNAAKSISEVVEYAGRAFKHIKEHNHAPTPKAYEVWYTYASNPHGELTAKLEEIVTQEGTICEFELEQIHDDHFGDIHGEEKAQKEFNNDVEKQLDVVNNLLQHGLKSSEDYSAALESVCDNLPSEPDHEQIKNVLAELVKDNLEMRAETEKLSRGLAKSQEKIQQLKSNLEEVRENSLKDPLTEVANRKYFQSALIKEIKRADEEATSLCLVIADIDHFKKVNDTFGHLVGDAILKYFSKLMVSSVKGRDVVARYGGEEFVIILPDISPENAANVVEKIRIGFENANLIIKDTGVVIKPTTASFGIAQYAKGDTLGKFIQRADENLYKAKNNGRNCVVMPTGYLSKAAAKSDAA